MGKGIGKTGQEGGQQALKIDFEEQKKNLWEEHSALGLLPATEELIKQADEDLEAFREKVKQTTKTSSTTRINANRVDTNTSAAKLQIEKKKRCTC